MARRAIVTLVLFFLSMNANAISYEVLEVVQGNSVNQPVSLANDVFDRDTYSRAYTHLNFIDAFPNGTYVPADYVPPGSTFRWRYYQDGIDQSGPPNNFLGQYSITFLGEVGSCPAQWSNGACGAFFGLFSALVRCIPEGKYRVEVLLDDSVLEERFFYPSRFNPFIDVVTIEGNPATPEQKEISGHPLVDATPITSQVRVKGVVGPNEECVTTNVAWMPDTIVKASNTIKPDTGSHKHFTDVTEIGTGKYMALKEGDVLNPGNTAETTKDTVIEGIVDRVTGTYDSTYMPGVFGVTEVITYQARREMTDRFPERVSGMHPEEVDIKVPGLLPMPESEVANLGQFKFAFGGTCAHSPTARYVTLDMFLALAKLDQRYRERIENRLSFNDASLQFGGLLDNKTSTNEETGVVTGGGRDNLCHVSHHRGIDIDINSTDEGGNNIRTATYERNGKSVPIMPFIIGTAKNLSSPLEKIDEESSIHFRLKAN